MVRVISFEEKGQQPQASFVFPNELNNAAFREIPETREPWYQLNLKKRTSVYDTTVDGNMPIS